MEEAKKYLLKVLIKKIMGYKSAKPPDMLSRLFFDSNSPF